MSKYRLIYFDIPGRAEVARLLFVLAGVDFEDKRVDKVKEWPALKPKMPFGNLPVLEIDDSVVLCQSHTIYRYLARKFGYGGKTDLDQARVDMIVDCVIDFFQPIVQGILFNTDPQDKAKNIKHYVDNLLPGLLQKFETFLSQNAAVSSYFVGDSMTVADIYFIERLSSLGPRIGVNVDMTPYPRIAALKDSVLGHPKIAAWKNKK